MAALGKIRSRGVTLIIIIGIGLFAFIAEEAFRSCESQRNNERQQVGEILGEKISYEDFAKLVDEAQDAMKVMGQENLTDDQLNQLRDQVWQNLVQYKLIEKSVTSSVLPSPTTRCRTCSTRVRTRCFSLLPS